jgi:crotonobetainyl-CoA:carnitine CoA-transferase CaiB-like acyl-CoA transferase
MRDGMLSGLKVLEAPDTLAAATGSFLASLGAEVVKLEPPGGEASRRLPNGESDPAWIGRNRGKRSVTANLATDEGRGLARRLVAAADIFLESFTEKEGRPLGLDPQTLAAANPRLIQVSVTPFGRNGPYAGYKGSELVCSALGGTLWCVGYEDRAPVKEALDACIFHAAAAAATGALFAHLERETSGLGQHVDVSVQEVAASRTTSGILAWQFDRRILRRTGVHVSYGQARVRYVWTLKDGYCFHGLMSGKLGAPANAALSAWMDEAGFDNPMRGVEWERYDRSALPAETRLAWEAAIDAFFRSRSKAEIREEGRRRGINATVANDPAEVLADPHLVARDFLGGWGETVRSPDRFLRADGADRLKGAAPPQAGADTDAVLRSWTPRSIAPTPRAAVEPPLKGVKVLDFSWALVGSITTKYLADFGAEVVKVETSTRPCLSRIDVQVAASKRGNFDDKPWFIHLNTSKRSLRLNMKRPGWREVIEPLIDWADLVVENFSPGTMKGLGLDYETLSARRPDLVMVSGSVFGQTGPLAREWGVDGTGAALSGRLHMTGWRDRPPVNPSFAPYGDVILPPLMAAAAAAALHDRRRTGQGRHIDASMYEACVQQMAAALVQTQVGPAPGRDGNRDPAVMHQGVYPAEGEDRWIALTVPDAPTWAALTALIGGGPWPDDADERDARISAWTRGRDRYDAMEQLQGAGVPAGVVQDSADVVDADPQLRGRDFLQVLENPVLGLFGHQAPPFKLSRTPAQVSTAPGLGQHTEEIVRARSGLSAERFLELQSSGLFE